MSTLILYGFLIAVFSVSYRLILAYQPVLSWWFQFGMRYNDKWFYKPIWGCELCFSGQLALWTYLISWLSVNFNTTAPFWRLLFKVLPNYHQTEYNALNGLIFIFGTVLLTNIFAHYFLKYIKNDK